MIPESLRRTFVVAVLLALSASHVAGQQIVRAAASRPVGQVTEAPLVEPYVAVDPRDPKHFLAAAMTPRAALQTIGCVAFASFDAGTSWIEHRVPQTVRACADVWTAIEANGNAVLSYAGDSGIVIWRSPDGGHTWAEPPTVVRGAHDHPMVVADTVRSALYLVSGLSVRNASRETRSAVFVARSTDGARTFAERARLIVSNLSYEAQTPVVLRDGEVLIATIDHHDASGRSLERRRAWVVRSIDSGQHFTEPLFVSESCSTTRFTAWPSLAVIPTSSGERIVFACEAQGNRGILLTRSADGGNKWTPVSRIDGAPQAASTKSPAMAVGSDGVLAVTWIDQRDDATGKCWHLYATASLDGGETFLMPQRLSETPSCPTSERNGAAVLDRFPTGGEYTGLAAIGPRRFLAIWPDARDGRFQLRSITFDVTPINRRRR
jgi:hypothetical protein